MSHELTADSRNVYVKAPWHFEETSKDGRSVLVAKPLTTQEAIEQSSIGSHVTIGERLFVEREGVYVPVEYKLLRNAADASQEYACVSDSYSLVQYRDMLEQLKPLEDLGVQWYAAGTLSHGGKAWMSGKLPDEWTITHKDGRSVVHLDHVNAQFCHDTTYVTSLYPSQFCVECANMLAMAQRDEERFGVRTKMVGDAVGRFGVGVSQLKTQLAAMKDQRAVVQELASTPMSAEQAGDYFARLLAEFAGTRDRSAAVSATFVASTHAQRQEVVGMLLDASGLKASESRAVRESMGVGKGLDLPAKTANLFANRYDRLMDLFSDGRTSKGADCYDALNAVTEWVDHDGVATFRGDAALASEKRFQSANTGDGAQIKARAYDLLVETVKVAA